MVEANLDLNLLIIFVIILRVDYFCDYFKGRWSPSAVASNSSRRRKLQNQTCVSGYALSRYARTVSVDGAEEII